MFDVVVERGSRHIAGRTLTFWCPDPNNQPDHSNQRIVEIGGPRENCDMLVQMECESENFKRLMRIDIFRVPYFIESEYERKTEKCHMADQQMLAEFLEYSESNWIHFLASEKYLGYDITEFYDFILEDITATFGDLDKTEQNLKKLRSLLQKKYNYFNIRTKSDSELISSIFRNFTGMELSRAKREIILILKQSRVVAEDENFSYGFPRISLHLFHCPGRMSVLEKDEIGFFLFFYSFESYWLVGTSVLFIQIGEK